MNMLGPQTTEQSHLGGRECVYAHLQHSFVYKATLYGSNSFISLGNVSLSPILGILCRFFHMVYYFGREATAVQWISVN